MKLKTSKRALSHLALFAFSPLLANAADIVIDGRTDTEVTTDGLVTDITTETLHGDKAYNSFRKFNVDTDDTVNLHQPYAANALINIITDHQVNIDGIVNGLHKGQLDANLVFAASNGMVVGKNGKINTGSLRLLTPSQHFVDSFFEDVNSIGEKTLQLQQHNVPLSDDGLVSVEGTIYTRTHTDIHAGSVDISGEIRNAALVVPQLVNTGTSANDLHIDQYGIYLSAGHGLTISGDLVAQSGTDLADGGFIEIRAKDIQVQNGALLDTSAIGGGNAGVIDILASNQAELHQGAELKSTAIAGTGGFIEFSAEREIVLSGGSLDASSLNGDGGAITIDPDTVTVSQNTLMAGKNIKFEADKNIVIETGVTVSSRTVGTVDHANADSSGDSGNIQIKAPDINIKAGAQVLAHATGDFKPGDVTISNLRQFDLGDIDPSQVSIGGKTLAQWFGSDKTIEDIATELGIDADDLARILNQDSTAKIAIGEGSGTPVLIKGGNIDIHSYASDRFGLSTNEAFIKKATASVDIVNATITGSDSVKVFAEADTIMLPEFFDGENQVEHSGFSVDLNDVLQTYLDGLTPPDSLYYINTQADATTTLGNGVSITQSPKVNVQSLARVGGDPASTTYFLGLEGIKADASATTILADNVQLTGDAVSVTSATESSLEVNAANSKPIPGAKFGLALGMVIADMTATTDVQQSATVSGTTVNIASSTEQSVTNTTSAEKTGGSTTMVAVGINDTNNHAFTTVAGTLNAIDAITVSAQTDTEDNEVSVTGGSAGRLGLGDRFNNLKNAAGGLLLSKALSPVTKWNEKAGDVLFKQTKAGKRNIAGAFSILDTDNTATATIADGARMSASKSIDVTSNVNDAIQVHANVNATSEGNAVGGALALTLQDNKANTDVQTNTVLTARAVNITADTQIEYPWSFDYKSLTDWYDFASGSWQEMLFNTVAFNANNAKKGGAAASVNTQLLNNSASAIVSDGATIHLTAGDANNNPALKVAAKTDTNMIGLAGKSPISNSKSAVGGSVSVVTLGGTTEARLGAATVDGEEDSSSVDVDAETIANYIEISESGGYAENMAIAGSVGYFETDFTTESGIDSDADITASKVSATTGTDQAIWNVAGELIASKGTAAGISVAINSLNSTTHAYVGDQSESATLTDHPNTAITADTVTVSARTDGVAEAISVTGAVSANSDSSGGTLSKLSNAYNKMNNGLIAATDWLNSQRGTKSKYNGSGVSGSQSEPNSEAPKYGIGLSGSASVNEAALITTAEVEHARISAKDLIVSAVNHTDITAAGGGASFVRANASGGKGSVAFAGSVAYNRVENQTLGAITDSVVGLADEVVVQALSGGEQLSVAIGLAVNASSNTQKAYSSAGSVSVTESANTTDATVEDSEINAQTSGQEVSITAYDKTDIGTGAGALFAGGRGGVGASVTVTTIQNSVSAELNRSSLNNFKRLAINAISSTNIVAGSAMAAGGTESSSLAGSFIFNDIGNTVSAGTSTVNVVTADSVTVNALDSKGDATLDGIITEKSAATDASQMDYSGQELEAEGKGTSILAVAGQIQAGKNNVGVSLVSNAIHNHYQTEITDSSLRSKQVDVGARGESESIALALGAALAKGSFAGAGSVVLNDTANVMSNTIANSTLAGAGTQVEANDKSTIKALAGQVAFSKKAAIGAAVASNSIANQVTSTLDGATLSLTQNADINAINEAAIKVIAAAGAAGSDGAVGASIGINTIGNQTTAKLSQGQSDSKHSLSILAQDNSSIGNITGAVAGAGKAAAGAAITVNTIDNQIDASVEGGVWDLLNYTQKALSSSRIDAIAIGLGASGQAALAGSVAVDTITSHTNASVADSASISADQNALVLAKSDDAITVAAGAAGVGLSTAGLGGSVAVNDNAAQTTAKVDGANIEALGQGDGAEVTDGSLTQTDIAAGITDLTKYDKLDLTQLQNHKTVHGVAINAASTQQIDTIAVSAGVGQYAGIAATVVVNSLGGQTEAALLNSEVNPSGNGASAQQVDVTASDHSYGNNFIGALGLSLEGAGIGVGSDNQSFSHTTRARIDTSSVNAKADVGLTAEASQAVTSTSLGGGGGLGALAASGSVIEFDAITEALVNGATLQAQDFRINALGLNDFYATDASAAFGGIAASGVWTVVQNNSHLEASATDSPLTISNSIAVNAQNTTELNGISAAGAGAGGYAVAGMGAYYDMKGSTTAGLYNSDNTGTLDSVSVAASETLNAKAFAGSVALGGTAGVGASVLVTNINSQVIAEQVDSGVDAESVVVSATTARSLDGESLAGAAGGTLGISGTALVANLGSERSAKADQEVDSDGDGTVSKMNQQAEEDKTASFANTKANIISSDQRQALATNTQTSLKSNASFNHQTKASVRGSDPVSANTLNVTATDNTDLQLTAGAGAIGGVAAGAAVIVNKVKNSTEAELAGNVDAATTHVNAIAQDRSKGIDTKAYAGAAGLLGLGAAVVINDIDNQVSTSLAGDIRGSDSLDVTAKDTSTASADLVNVSAGVVGAGAVVGELHKASTITTDIAAQLHDFQTVNLTANSTGAMSATGFAAAGGILGSANAAVVTVDQKTAATVTLADNLNWGDLGSAVIKATGGADASSRAEGVSVTAGLGMGASIAIAENSAQSVVEVGDNVSIAADAISFESSYTNSEITAEAFASTGGLVSATASQATARNTANVSLTVGDNAHFDAAELSLTTQDDSTLDATSSGLTVGGLAAVGANKAASRQESENTLTVGKNLTLSHNDNTDISAESNNQSRAKTVSGSGGLITGVSSIAETDTQGSTRITFGGRDDALQLKVGDLSLFATRNNNVNSRVDATAASLVGASGASAKNTVQSNAEVNIREGASINAEQATLLAKNTLIKDWWSGSNADNARENAKSASGGAIDAPAASSDTNATLTARVNIAQANASTPTAIITQQSGTDAQSHGIDIRALNDVTARDKTVLNSGGAVSVADASSKLVTTGNATINVGDQAGLSAVGLGQGVLLSALNRGNLDSNASADSYGLAGAPSGAAWSKFYANSNVDLAVRSLIMANKGDVFIGAGEDDQGGQVINARARVNLWNKTAVPISTDPDAVALINSNSDIQVRGNPGAADSGANVLADQSIYLYANRGQQNVDAKGTGKDLYREVVGAVASGISEAFGGGKVSLDIHHQTNTQSGEATVQVDGHVESSIHRKQYLTITDSATEINNGNTKSYGITARQIPENDSSNQVADGSSQYYVFQSSDGIHYDAPRVESIIGKLDERIKELRKLQSEYSNDEVAQLAYQAEINFLEKQKEALGLSFSAPANEDGSGGTLQYDSFFANRETLQLQYNDLDSSFKERQTAVSDQLSAFNTDITSVNNAQTAFQTLSAAQAALNAELAKDSDDQDAATVTALTNARNAARTNYESKLSVVATDIDSAIDFEKTAYGPVSAEDTASIDAAIASGDQASIASAIGDANTNIEATEANNIAGQIVQLTSRKQNVEGQIADNTTDASVLTTQKSYLQSTRDTYETEENQQLASLQTALDNFKQDIDQLPADYTGPIGDFVAVHDIDIPLGNVSVKADNLVGQGNLWAPGDAEVKVDSSSPVHLTFGSIRIDDDGGNLYFNRGLVYSNADINRYNQSGVANFNVVTNETSVPQVDIQTHYNPLNVADTSRVRAVAPDLRFGVSGKARSVIKNARGAFSVLSEAGSLYFENTDVLAGKIDIKAKNGSFVQSYAADGSSQDDGSAFYHVAGDPGSALTSNRNTPLSSAIGDGSGKGIISNGDVFLAARYLNINGTIQSGIENWAIEIPSDSAFKFRVAASNLDSDLRAKVDKLHLGQAYTDNDNYVEFGLPYAEAYFTRLQASQGAATALDLPFNLSLATGEEALGATFHMSGEGHNIQLDGVEVNGGFIQVLGQIMNTSANGKGKLRVLDGYGKIRVDNQSDYPLYVNSVSTGRGVEGIVDITDIREQEDGKIKTLVNTVYRRFNGVQETSSVTLHGITESAPDLDARNWTTSGADSYLPKGYSANNATDGQWYVWTEGLDFSEKKRYEITSDVLIGAIDISSKLTDKYLVSSKVLDSYRVGDGTFLLNGLDPSKNPELDGLGNTKDLTDLRNNIKPDRTSLASNTHTTSTSKPKKIKSWNNCNWWTLCIASKRHEIWEKTVGKTNITKKALYASYPIGIEFIGDESGGDINIQSSKDIVLQGNMVNGSGGVDVRSAQGDIKVANQQAVLRAGIVQLFAQGDIGTALNGAAEEPSFVNMDLGTNGKVMATSQTGNVQLRTATGQMTLGDISAAKTANISAAGDLRQSSGDVLKAQRANIVSTGGIGSETEMLQLQLGYSADFSNPESVGLNAEAGGNIYLQHTGNESIGNKDGHLLVDQVVSLGGDVVLHSSGDIVDNNPDQSIDQRTWDQLISYWDGLSLLKDTQNNKEKQAREEKNFGALKTQDYRSYWAIRNTQDDPSVYNPDFTYHVSDVEKQSLQAAYLQQDQTLTEQQMQDKIAVYATQRTDFYHELHTSLGALTDGAYDPTYHYQLTDADKANLLDGSSWTEVELGLALKPGALKELTDTNPILKAPNVQGDSVTLVSDTSVGDKGFNSGTFVITVDTANPAATVAALTDEEKVALASAEVGDISIQDNVITVTRHSPLVVGVNSNGALDVSAMDNIYLASEQAVRLNQLQADKVISIKSADGITPLTSGSCGAHICAESVILEAGEGGIASVAQPIRVSASKDLTLRGTGDAVVSGAELPIASAYSAKGAVVLTTTGSITDALPGDNNYSLNILADDVRLSAGVSIGEVDNSLEVATQAKGSEEKDCADDPLCEKFQAKGIQADAGVDIYLAAPSPRYLVTKAVDAGANIRIAGGSPQLVIDGVMQAGGTIDVAASESLLLTQNAHVLAKNGADLTVNISSEQDIHADPAAKIDVLGGNLNLTALGTVDIPGVFTNPDGALTGDAPVAPSANAQLDIAGQTNVDTSGSVVMTGQIKPDGEQASGLNINSGELIWLEDLSVAGKGNLNATQSTYTSQAHFEGDLNAKAPQAVEIHQTTVDGELIVNGDRVVVDSALVNDGDLMSEQSKSTAISNSRVNNGTVQAVASERIEVRETTVAEAEGSLTLLEAPEVESDILFSQQGRIAAVITGTDSGLAETVDWKSATSQGNPLYLSKLSSREANVEHEGNRIQVQQGQGDLANFQSFAANAQINNRSFDKSDADVQFYNPDPSYWLDMDGNKISTNALLMYRRYGYDVDSPLGKNVTLADYSTAQTVLNQNNLQMAQTSLTQSNEPVVTMAKDSSTYWEIQSTVCDEMAPQQWCAFQSSEDNSWLCIPIANVPGGRCDLYFNSF